MDFKKHYNVFMLMDCNNNLIAEWRTIESVLPYAQYKSGARDEHNPNYQNPYPETSNPILRLEFDILNRDGFGLKQGFYEIAVDSDFTYLMFVERGTIKAKIPVLKYELINKYGTDYEWPEDKDKKTPSSVSYNIEGGAKVSLKKIYRPQYSEKEQKQREKKYRKGQDPSLHFHSKAYLEYDNELDLYRLIFEKYNTRVIGIIKI